jgi:gluconolactonase
MRPARTQRHRFRRHGGFWFTDHGKIDYATRSHDVVGVFYAKADGGHLGEVIFPSNNPNGIGLSPDSGILYVAETYTCRLVRFEVTAPGKVDLARRLGGTGFPLYHSAGWKHFDSLDVEAGGISASPP